jgi:hypothetical protein
MMEKLYLPEFFKALWANWIRAWGGVAGVILTISTPYITTVEWQRASMWLVAAICVMQAFHGAWLAVYKQLLEFEPAPLDVVVPPTPGQALPPYDNIYFRLVVRNTGRRTAEECRVTVRKIVRKIAAPNQKEWKEQALPQMVQLPWTPRELNEPHRSIGGGDEATFDFGWILKFSNMFYLCCAEKDFYIGEMRGGETCRYYVYVGGKNGVTPERKPSVIQVFWDGVQNKGPGGMKDHIRFEKVNYEAAEAETIPA